MFTRQSILRLCKEHPEIALAIQRICARDRVQLHDHIDHIGHGTARDRIVHLLLRLYFRARDEVKQALSGVLPLGQQDISDLLGLTHVHTNRVLQTLKSAGLIQTQRGQIKIVDAAGLAKLIGIDAATL